MTKSEMAKILNNMVFIVDTREKKNKHIIDYLERNNLPYIKKKLDSGDYSYYLPDYPELDLDMKVLVERKNSWDEISQNFTKNRERFIREFNRIDDANVHILIENASWLTLMRGSYRSNMTPKSLLANILTWNARYNASIWLSSKKESPTLIFNLLKYGLREKIKNKSC